MSKRDEAIAAAEDALLERVNPEHPRTVLEELYDRAAQQVRQEAVEELTAFEKNVKALRKQATDAMPDKHAETVDEGIEVGKLLGQRAAYTQVLMDLVNLEAKVSLL